MQYTVIRSDRRTLCMEIKDGKVIVRVPKRCSDKQISEFVAKNEQWAIKKLEQLKNKPIAPIKAELSPQQIKQLKELAAKKILPRARELSRVTGMTAKSFGITKARGRFGSCSGKDSINFSCFLALYADELIDYVIIHELCHTVHKNHSSAFYALLQKYLPNYKELQKRLKKGEAI